MIFVFNQNFKTKYFCSCIYISYLRNKGITADEELSDVVHSSYLKMINNRKSLAGHLEEVVGVGWWWGKVCDYLRQSD